MENYVKNVYFSKIKEVLAVKLYRRMSERHNLCVNMPLVPENLAIIAGKSGN